MCLTNARKQKATGKGSNMICKELAMAAMLWLLFMQRQI